LAPLNRIAAVIGAALRLAAIVTATGLLAFGASACGGGDDSGTTSGSATTSQNGGGSTATTQGGGSGGKGGGGGESAKPGGSGSSGAKVAPVRVSGGGSGQFRTPGGDNSIQNFGEEGDESELQAAAEAVHGFYVARAEEDWARACSYLAKSMVAQLEQLAQQAPQLKGKGCGAILHAFTRPLPASARRESTVVDAGSLRIEGERAFLIYYGAGKTVYAISMAEQAGDWKVAALAGVPLD